MDKQTKGLRKIAGIGFGLASVPLIAAGFFLFMFGGLLLGDWFLGAGGVGIMMFGFAVMTKGEKFVAYMAIRLGEDIRSKKKVKK